MTTTDYSLDKLGKFLDYAAEKGLLKPNTAASRKQAAIKIFSVLEPEELQDLREVDVEHAFERFQNLQGTKYKPASLKVYQTRLKSALTDFFSYQDNPALFKPAGIQRTTTKSRPNTKNEGQSKQTENNFDTDDQRGRISVRHPPANQLDIPVPLRAGLVVHIKNIPPDLTQLEAAKLAAIVKAYALPEE